LPVIFFYGPTMSDDKKREMIGSFTDTASKLTGIDKSAFTIILRPTATDDVGVGGELLKDRLEAKD